MAGNHALSVSKNFCYVGGETADELYDRLVAFNAHPDLEDQIAEFANRTNGSVTHAQAVANVQAAMPGTTVVSDSNAGSAPETLTDKYGNKYTYNHPDAQTLADGQQEVLKEWVSKAGKSLKAWKHPMAGPKPSGGDAALKDHNRWAD